MSTIRLIPGLLAGLLLLSSTAPDLEAQLREGTHLGLRGGVTVSSLDGGETLDPSNRTGFAGGIFLDYGVTRPVGFQIGAQYSQRGAELDLGEAVEDFSLNYLEIPAVIKVGLPLGILKPSVLGGVALGFRTGCEQVRGFDCEEEITSTEWAGLLGADVILALGGLNLFADGRYHFGLNDISDAADLGELKNRAWTLQAGLGFPIGG